MAARDFDDAFAMLRSIAAHPAIFTDVAADAARTAQLLEPSSKSRAELPICRRSARFVVCWGQKGSA